MAKNKYFKGTTLEFKEYLNSLYISTIEEDKQRYEDIKNSVVYISEHMALDPADSSHCDEGAIYAHGAIIAGSTYEGPYWDDDIVDTSVL